MTPYQYQGRYGDLCQRCPSPSVLSKLLVTLLVSHPLSDSPSWILIKGLSFLVFPPHLFSLHFYLFTFLVLHQHQHFLSILVLYTFPQLHSHTQQAVFCCSPLGSSSSTLNPTIPPALTDPIVYQSTWSHTSTPSSHAIHRSASKRHLSSFRITHIC